MHSGTRLRASVASLKNPAYTGGNRCLPCTVLNVAIAAALSVAVAVVVTAKDAWLAVGVGAVTFAVATALIYLRGYLIPGTPVLTRRYFPARLLALFETAPDRIDWDEADPREVLLEAGVVVDDPSAADLAVDPAFAARWERTTARLWADERALETGLADLVDADPDRLEFEDRPRSFVARADGDHLAHWPSRAACVADAAAATILPDWDPEWSRRSLALRADVLGVLRLFLERCPACDGTVSLSQEVVESCCRRRDVVAATCRECDARLFEVDVDPSQLASDTEPFDDR